MERINLKLKTYYARNADNVAIINQSIEKLTLRAILYAFGGLGVLYVFLLVSTVINIVERRTLETDARSLGSEVRDLELTYLSLSNSIDLERSYALGFKETKTNFATRKSLGYRPTGEALGSIKMPQNDL